MSDLHGLHEILRELEIMNKDVAHSLEHQLTFVQKLDCNVRVNSDAILNLFSILKRELVQSQNITLHLHRDLAWLN
jgi:hypothetical protein